MSQLIRWDPFREMEDMQSSLTSLFNQRPLFRRENNRLAGGSDWVSIVDITEDDKTYTIKAELPEVKKEDVKVTLEDGVLTLTGERKFEKQEKHRKYHRVERAYGSFTRSFTLPENAQVGKIHAAYKDGMLTVTINKVGHSKSHQIEVKVS